MGFVLISPLMYFVWRKRVLGAIGLLGLMALNIYDYYAGFIQVPLNVNSNNLPMFCYQYVFFAAGSYAAIHGKRLVENPSSIKARLGMIAILLLVGVYYCVIRKYGDVIINHTFRLLFCIAFWFAYDGMKMPSVKPWMKYSFFIYCCHLFIIMCAQGITRIIFSRIGLEVLHIPEYFILPIITIIIIIQIADMLKKYLPSVWKVVTGARG